jgi:dipeptidyl aminopeptidase/acylaminoacyl peptidase
MFSRNTFFLLFLLVILGSVAGFFLFDNRKSPGAVDNIKETIDGGGLLGKFNPLSIESLKNEDYPGSDFVIEQTLDPGSNYNRFIASYKSEGLKIYGLLTIPTITPPSGGFPAIIFNHGYIPPSEYRTTERYVAYLDGFARNGYIVFRPDYRGHGNSEGDPTGAYGSNSYTIDVLNAVASVRRMKEVNPAKMGMWGHSMGGYITLRSMVTKKDIKAGVIWAGVVASYPDLLSRWRRNRPSPTPGATGRTGWRQTLLEKFGDPQSNPEFWNSISANSYLSDISGPIQLHHGTSDESVPVEFSEKLTDQMKSAGKTVELYTYPGDDHNISGNFNTAIQRSIEFFDRYLK